MIEPAARAEPDARARLGGFLQQDESTFEAWQLTRKRCMSEAGFKFEPKQASNYDVTRDGGFMPRLTVEEARTSGYSTTQAFLDEDRQEQAAEDTPEGYDKALYGTDADEVVVEFAGKSVSAAAGGCTGVADERVYGSAKNQILLTDVGPNLVFDVMTKIRDTPTATTEIVDDWAACMRSSGYPQYRGPAEAFRQTIREPGLAGKVAVADATCRQRTGYQTRMDDVIDRYFTGFLNRYETDIALLTKVRSSAAVRAHKILESSN